MLAWMLCGALIAGAAVGKLAGAPTWVAIAYAGLGIFVACLRLEAVHRRRRLAADVPAGSGPPGATREVTALALGYLRVGQSSRPTSGQTAAMREVCDANGLQLSDVVWDVDGETGPRGAYPGLSWALERLAGGEAGALIIVEPVHRTDSISEFSQLLTWFGDHQLRLIAIDLQPDSSRAGQMIDHSLVVAGAPRRPRPLQIKRGLDTRSSYRRPVADVTGVDPHSWALEGLRAMPQQQSPAPRASRRRSARAWDR